MCYRPMDVRVWITRKWSNNIGLFGVHLCHVVTFIIGCLFIHVVRYGLLANCIVCKFQSLMISLVRGQVHVHLTHSRL